MWVIGALLLLVFGAKKLPELARAMGSSVTQFKKGLKQDPDLLDDPEKGPSESSQSESQNEDS